MSSELNDHTQSLPPKKKVFIVHGHDQKALNAVHDFVKKLGLDPIILQDQASLGRTVIEKFEEHAQEAGYAIVLLTPDDKGGTKRNIKSLTDLELRARQNVIFELGFFYGKLGRNRVCGILKGDLKRPSDVEGIVWILLSKNRDWQGDLRKEMVKAGLIPPTTNEAVLSIAGRIWRLEHGVAEVSGDGTIRMPQKPSDNPKGHASLLVSEKPAASLREMTFTVNIPPGAIFNFVYNYSSRTEFRAVRIEGRAREDGTGFDNGLLGTFTNDWGDWVIYSKYTNDSEPNPNKRNHIVRVAFEPPGTFDVFMDNKLLRLEDEADWEFKTNAKIGFMTEGGTVSVSNLRLIPQ